MRWFFFLVMAGVSWAVRLLGKDTVDDPAGSALLALGCLVIGGFLAGNLAVKVRLPRITGYLVLGMVVGPYAIGLETLSDAHFLHLFEDLALGLIALTAGGEFRLAGLRQRAGTLGAITGAHLLIFPVVGGAMWLFFSLVPVLGNLNNAEKLAAAALLGVIAVAVSPSTTIAVITELKAKGEVTEIVLGTTILKDILILLLFTWVNVMAHAWVEGTPVGFGILAGVGKEILASIAVGILLGGLLGVYMSRVGRHVPLTVLALALVSTEMARTAHLEHLLVCMAAGFVVRNFFPREASTFLDALERSSPPIYIVFFALVGAGLDLRVFALVWIPALVYVGVRLISVWFFTTIPSVLVRAHSAVTQRAWMGFVAQAGLSLGLAARIQRENPEFGAGVALLIVASVVINQLIGPVMWARALRDVGEAGED
ncbi:MAG: cation:proton antiporter [Thermoanaerobaculales bacterium]|nr:cation:proton antiporter [Thermoanaerobaculales bacterium]